MKTAQNIGKNHFFLSILGMTCASCVGKVEMKLLKILGVTEVSVNLMFKKGKITYEGNPAQEKVIKAYCIQKCKALGYDASAITVDKEYKIKITGMSCYSCVGKIESAISKITGVDEINVNLSLAQATIKYSGTTPN